MSLKVHEACKSKIFMNYIHTDIFVKQTSKIHGNPCGDVFDYFRDEFSTTLVLSDGLGSGIKANIAATMCVSRLINLVKSGATIHEAFQSLLLTMNKAWGNTQPFAVFTIAKILNTGQTTILSYEMPPALLISDNNAEVLEGRIYTSKKAIISEVHTTISEKEGILLVSDGITQAGLGQGLANGWEIENVAKFLSATLYNDKIHEEHVVNFVHKQARKFWGNNHGDDCSVVLAQTRRGITLNLLTGPPQDESKDPIICDDFQQSKGLKVVCGGSTAKMLAREIKTGLEIKSSQSLITPPKYSIYGITLVTEGIVTLNQVYNVFDENLKNNEEMDTDSPVFELFELLHSADKIVFLLGEAQNISTNHITFRQQGILQRRTIIELLIDKLQQLGKLVIVKEY